MAMKACRECKAKISTSASSCPTCGAPARKPTSALTQLVAAFIAASVGMVIILMVTSSYQSEREAERRAADNAIIDKGLRAAMSPQEFTEYKARAAKEVADAAKRVADQAAYKTEKSTAVANIHRDVEKVLRDPDSAKFGQMQMYTNTASRLGFTACGYVSSKNGFGGYVGDTAYIVVDRTARVNDGSDGFASQWNKLCK
jgi:hypothetical protein